MEFGPDNQVVKLCIQGLGLEEGGKPEEARSFFVQAWDLAHNDLEKFVSAHFLARCQKQAPDRLRWLETALHHAEAIADDSVRSAFPSLYAAMADCHEQMGQAEQAEGCRQLAKSSDKPPSDGGPFYHGTKAELKPGELLKPGMNSNYKTDLVMNHIYFTAWANGAGLAAELAKGEGIGRVYVVEPTGPFEDDPNVTNKKFPGNLTRSYRSREPLKVVGEVAEWKKQTPEELEQWRKSLAKNKGGKIIN